MHAYSVINASLVIGSLRPTHCKHSENYQSLFKGKSSELVQSQNSTQCVCHHRPTMTQCVSSPYNDTVCVITLPWPVCVSSSLYDDTVCVIALRWHSVCVIIALWWHSVCHCPTMTQCVSSPYSSNPASTPCVLFEHCDFVSVVIVLCDVMSVLQLRWRVQGGISGSKTGPQKVPSLLARQLSLQLSVDMCVDCSVMSCYYCVVREVSVWQVSWRQDSSSSNS